MNSDDLIGIVRPTNEEFRLEPEFPDEEQANWSEAEESIPDFGGYITRQFAQYTGTT